MKNQMDKGRKIMCVGFQVNHEKISKLRSHANIIKSECTMFHQDGYIVLRNTFLFFYNKYIEYNNHNRIPYELKDYVLKYYSNVRLDVLFIRPISLLNLKMFQKIDFNKILRQKC